MCKIPVPSWSGSADTSSSRPAAFRELAESAQSVLPPQTAGQVADARIAADKPLVKCCSSLGHRPKVGRTALLRLGQSQQRVAIRLGTHVGLVLSWLVLLARQATGTHHQAAGSLYQVWRRDAVDRHHRWRRPVALQPSAAVSRLRMMTLTSFNHSHQQQLAINTTCRVPSCCALFDKKAKSCHGTHFPRAA